MAIWKPGESGNPAGRKPGSRNKLGEDFLAKLRADFEADGAAVIEYCRKEKPDVYLRVIASVLPKDIRGDLPEIDLGDTSTAKGTTEALTRIIAAVSQGAISTSEGTDLANLVELQRRSIETQDLAERISRLEAAKVSK